MSRRATRVTQLLISAVVVGALALALLAVGSVAGRPPSGPDASSDAQLDPLTRSIAVAQQRLTEQPKDYRTWASLALTYVDQARTTGDPTHYAKAESAVARSMALDTKQNDVAFAALSAIKAAEHDFPAALAAARRGLAINSYSSTLYGALADALTQLGQYAEAEKAIDRMNGLRPGVPAFTRAAYALELRGDIAGSRVALERALRDAISPGEKAFARTYLGELSLNYGADASAALRHFDEGLAVAPRDHVLRAARAKALAALGRVDEALVAYDAVVSASPQPQYVLEHAELLAAAGRQEDADQQLALFRVEEDLFRANNVILDVEPTLFEADHGSPTKALQLAVEGWRVRPFVEMADAYAWALHVNGRDAEALRWSERAFATGWPNALHHYHRGIIRLALGDTAAGKADLRRALQLNPAFSALHAPLARQALKG